MIDLCSLCQLASCVHLLHPPDLFTVSPLHSSAATFDLPPASFTPPPASPVRQLQQPASSILSLDRLVRPLHSPAHFNRPPLPFHPLARFFRPPILTARRFLSLSHPLFSTTSIARQSSFSFSLLSTAPFARSLQPFASPSRPLLSTVFCAS